MPRRCTICTHPDCEAINAALVSPACVLRAVSGEYGVSRNALARHRAHIPEHLSKAEAAETVVADDLLGKVAELEADAKRIGQAAEDKGDSRTALMAVRELVRIVELLAKLRGELQQGVHFHYHDAPEWVEVRQVVFASLAPHPEARVAVAEALAAIEGTADAGD